MSEIAEKHYQRALHLSELKRWKESILEAAKCLATDPNHYHSQCVISLCHLEMGDNKKALEFAEKAIACNPEEEWGHRLRSIILNKLGQKKESLKSAEEAVRIAPDELFTLFTLASFYLDSHQIRKAKKIAEQMSQRFPTADLTFLVRGNIYLQTGKPSEAEDCFRESLKFNPNNSLARNNLGVAILDQERQKPALNRDKAVSLFGDSLHEDTAVHFTEALKLEPNNALLIENIKSQFSYLPFFFVYISLLPFLLLIFLVFPLGAIGLGIIIVISLINLTLETFRRKKTATPELKLLFKSSKRKSLSEQFEIFRRVFQKIVIRNWQPHLLALLAVMMSFLANYYSQGSSTRYLLIFLSVLTILGSGVWLLIKIKKG